MARALKEWVGETADSKIPDRVRRRVFDAHGGICHISGRKIRPPADAWDLDHVIALINWTGEGHGNRESNLAPALRDKHREKTARDVAEKATADRKRSKHLGIKKPSGRLRGPGFRKPEPQNTATRPIQWRT